MSRKLSKHDLVEAIRKNGYEQAFGGMINAAYVDNKAKIYSACALGQAGLNLRIDPFALEHILKSLPRVNYDFYLDYRVPTLILTLNDSEHNTLEEIADILDEVVPDFELDHDESEFDFQSDRF